MNGAAMSDIYDFNHKTPTKALREIALNNRNNAAILSRICEILSDRRNDAAFEALLEVGRLLDVTKKRAVRDRNQRQNIGDLRGGQNDSSELTFPWPEVDCPAQRHGYHQSRFYRDAEGLMSYVGYRVGAKGLPRNIRWKILDCILHNPLPNVISENYMSEWGEPQSDARLTKMKNCLTAFAESPRTGDWRKAISEWHEDLEYLERAYS